MSKLTCNCQLTSLEKYLYLSFRRDLSGLTLDEFTAEIKKLLTTCNKREVDILLFYAEKEQPGPYLDRLNLLLVMS
jgi:hypothetical protein